MTIKFSNAPACGGTSAYHDARPGQPRRWSAGDVRLCVTAFRPGSPSSLDEAEQTEAPWRRGFRADVDWAALLDEQHLRVLRQRPEVVGDEPLEHVRASRTPSIAGMTGRACTWRLEALDLRVAPLAFSSATIALDELVDRRELGLDRERPCARGVASSRE